MPETVVCLVNCMLTPLVRQTKHGTLMTETILDWSALIGLGAVFVLLWRVSRDLARQGERISQVETSVTKEIGKLAERLARIEGFIVGRFGPPSPQPD